MRKIYPIGTLDGKNVYLSSGKKVPPSYDKEALMFSSATLWRMQPINLKFMTTEEAEALVNKLTDKV